MIRVICIGMLNLVSFGRFFLSNWTLSFIAVRVIQIVAERCQCYLMGDFCKATVIQARKDGSCSSVNFCMI